MIDTIVNDNDMIIRLVTFAIGMVIGVSIMFVLGWPASILDDAAQITLSQDNALDDADSVAQARAPAADNGFDDSRPESEGFLLSDDSNLVYIPIRIPSTYRKLIGPILPRSRSNSQWHAIFENEPRDEAWAVAMETGIKDHYAKFGELENAVAEYVECRSNFCEIAGYVEDGYSGITGQVYIDMTRSGWWQADGGTHLTGGHVDGIDRFIYFISRYGME